MNVNRKNSVISIVIIGLLLSCSSCITKNDKGHSDVEVISINPTQALESIKLSEIAESLEVIRLKTDSDNPMGAALKVVVKDNHIYVATLFPFAIFIFDMQGEFVAKLDKLGRGPAEYSSVVGFVIDDNEEYIEIFNEIGSSVEVLKYSNLTFDLLSKTTMEWISANSFVKVDDLYYFSAQQMENTINQEKRHSDLIVVEDGKVVKDMFRKDIMANKTNSYTFFTPHPESFTVNDKGELFVSIMYDNMLYEIEKRDAIPLLEVDFGKYGIDNNKVGKMSNHDQIEYLNSMSEVAMFPILNINDPKVRLISYYYKSNRTEGDTPQFGDLFHYIECNGETYHTKRIENDLSDFPDYINLGSYMPCHQISHNGYFVEVISPWEIIPDGEEKIVTKSLGEITQNDNPIVLLMKYREEI